MEKIRFENLIDKSGNTIELDLPDRLNTQEKWAERDEIRRKARLSGKEALKILKQINKRSVWLEEQHINDRNLQELGKSFKFNDSRKKDTGEV